jgi:hypothetical protein
MFDADTTYQFIKAHRAELLACLPSNLPPGVSADERSSLALRIDPNGEISDANLQGYASESTRTCIETTARRWQAPSRDGGTCASMLIPVPLAAPQ